MEILLITKSEPHRRFQRHCLAGMGIDHVAEADDVVNAMAAVLHKSFDLILTDLLPGEGGLTLIKQIQLCDPNVQVVIVTENAAPECILSAWDAGCADYILLPTNPDEFCERVGERMQCRRVRTGETADCRLPALSR